MIGGQKGKHAEQRQMDGEIMEYEDVSIRVDKRK